MSILYQKSSLYAATTGNKPDGSYNAKTQTWEFEENVALDYQAFLKALETFPIATYCVTTSGGWDQDTDDSLT